MQCRERSTQDLSGVGPRTCADCGGEMVLAALLPRLSALPALRSYRCPCCGNVELDVLEHLRDIPAGSPRGTRMSWSAQSGGGTVSRAPASARARRLPRRPGPAMEARGP